jgi:hypothetical protein
MYPDIVVLYLPANALSFLRSSAVNLTWITFVCRLGFVVMRIFVAQVC